MAAKKKRVDPIKQRERRARIFAIIGVVLLLAVGAYEVPSMLKLMNQKPPPGADATDAGNRSANGSIPLPNVSGAPTGVSSNGELADTDVPPTASNNGQLVSFSVFDTKNPFAPQVSTAPSDTSSSSSAGTTANKPGADVPPTTTTPTQTTPTQTTPTTPTETTPTTVVPSGPTSTTPTTTTSSQPTVSISVNGVVSHVADEDTFPSGAPVFRLVSWTKSVAQIGIVGGSYSTGDPTLTLHLGQSVTLENSTNNKIYKLILVSTPS